MRFAFTTLAAATVLGCGTLLLAHPSVGTRSPARPASQATQASLPPASDTITLSSEEQTFITDAAMGGMTVVEQGKLAAQKAVSPSVRALGQQMAADHAAVNSELKSLAMSKRHTLPPGLDSISKERVDQLARLSGAEFDLAYVKDALQDHERDIVRFRSEASLGKDAAVKAWAAKTLPTLEQHLRLVKDLYRDLAP